MNRISYVLFAVMIFALGISLFLYNSARKNSLTFNERVTTVNRVLLLLERTEHLKNILRKTIFQSMPTEDSTLLFTTDEKIELDSLLNVLHSIALYQEQRFRVDTLRRILNSNYGVLLGKERGKGVMDYDPSTTEVIARAKQYSKMRLAQQEEQFDRFDANANFWATSILVISTLIFVTGVWSTIYENRSKVKLKNLHESILSNASVGICVYEINKDIEGHIIPTVAFSNFGATTKVHHDDTEVIVDLCKVPIGNKELIESMKLVLASGKTVIREVKHFFNGKQLWFLTNLSKVSANKVAFYYQDISRIKNYEMDLKMKVSELEAVNKDLEQFAHATSHDLREPFRKIQVMSDMIYKNHNSANNAKYLDVIMRASNKGAELVEQILNYSKVQFDKSHRELVDLNKLVSHVVEDFDLVILEKGATITSSSLPIVYANRIQMTQLFSNLISNSLKFMKSDRKPVISISCKESDGITDLDPSLKYYVITVKDNGVGFDSSYTDKIFTAFSRLHHYQEFPGFGLGLSLCKKVAVNHGGMIKATSVIGEGSSFDIYLPKNTF
jgi:signal transduction histidine kinase